MDNGRTKVLTDPIGPPGPRLHPLRLMAEHLPGLPAYLRPRLRPSTRPIGAILTPQLTQGLPRTTPAHPAFRLPVWRVGEVRPVAIDIPTILIHMRARTVDQAQPRARRGTRAGRGHARHVELDAVKKAEPGIEGHPPFAKKGAIGALPFPAFAVDRARGPAGRPEGDLSVVEAHPQRTPTPTRRARTAPLRDSRSLRTRHDHSTRPRRRRDEHHHHGRKRLASGLYRDAISCSSQQGCPVRPIPRDYIRSTEHAPGSQASSSTK